MRFLSGVFSGLRTPINYTYVTTTLYSVPLFEEVSFIAERGDGTPYELGRPNDQYHISGISLGGTNTVNSVVEQHDVFDIGEYHISGISLGGTNTVNSVVEQHDVFDIGEYHISGISLGGTNTVTEVVVEHDVFDIDEYHISGISLGGTNTIG